MQAHSSHIHSNHKKKEKKKITESLLLSSPFSLSFSLSESDPNISCFNLLLESLSDFDFLLFFVDDEVAVS